jgi:hypothetical protein
MTPLLEEALQSLEEAMATSPPFQETHARVQVVLDRLRMSNPLEVNVALARMAGLLSGADLLGAAAISIACGAVVEDFGGDPLIPLQAVLTRVKEAIALAIPLAAACHRAAEAAGEELEVGTSVIEVYGPQVMGGMVENARAWAALDFMGPAAVALLAASAEARRIAWQDRALVEGARQLAPDHEWARYIADLAQVLDGEELLVLHPGLRRGYRVRISGIADNFQLHTLLADALIGDPLEGLLPGERPDARVVAAARDRDVDVAASDARGIFTLMTWRGLQADQSLSTETMRTDNWIEHNDTPADIPLFDGVRVVLLGPPPYVRAWSSGRRHIGMHGDARVVKVLSEQEVEDHLRRIASVSQLDA